LNPKIISVNISDKKGIPKTPVNEIELIENLGVKDDAHATPGDRQVSLLALESYRKFEKQKLNKICLKHGAFGENIITSGLILHKLPIGTKLKINDTILEVSKIGKECHTGCNIAKTLGSCIMPKEGIFASVIKAGTIKKDSVIHLI
jgi:cyclic pyranopterin monophosphate synthase